MTALNTPRPAMHAALLVTVLTALLLGTGVARAGVLGLEELAAFPMPNAIHLEVFAGEDPRSARVVTATGDNKLDLHSFDLQSRELVLLDRFELGPGGPASLLAKPDGKGVYVGGFDGSVRSVRIDSTQNAWDFASERFQVSVDPIFGIGTLFSGPGLYATDNASNEVVQLDYDGVDFFEAARYASGGTQPVDVAVERTTGTAAVLHDDGSTTFFARGADNSLSLIDNVPFGDGFAVQACGEGSFCITGTNFDPAGGPPDAAVFEFVVDPDASTVNLVNTVSGLGDAVTPSDLAYSVNLDHLLLIADTSTGLEQDNTLKLLDPDLQVVAEQVLTAGAAPTPFLDVETFSKGGEEFAVTLEPGEDALKLFLITDTAPATQPPVAVPNGPYVFDADFAVPRTMFGTGSADPDGGDIEEFLWTWPAATALKSETGESVEVLFVDTLLTTTGDKVDVVLTVTDDEGETGTATTRFEYENSAPEFTGPVSVISQVDLVNEGRLTYTVVGDAVDLDLAAPVTGFEVVRFDLSSATGASLATRALTSPQSIEAEFSFGTSSDLLAAALGATGRQTLTLAVTDLAEASESLDVTIHVGNLASTVAHHGDTGVIESRSPTTLSQTVDVPSSPFTFQFDYLFETLTGELVVSLGSDILLTLPAPGSPQSLFTTVALPIDDLALLGLADLELAFTVDGPTGSRVLLDNVLWPGLLNGDFATGDLTGWTLTASDPTAGGVERFVFNATTGVPSPGTLPLLAAAALLPALWRRRRRSACPAAG